MTEEDSGLLASIANTGNIIPVPVPAPRSLYPESDVVNNCANHKTPAATAAVDGREDGGGGSLGSRWIKLRGTIQVANAVSAPSTAAGRRRRGHGGGGGGLAREDSFLKKFSTRHGGGPYIDRRAAPNTTPGGGSNGGGVGGDVGGNVQGREEDVEAASTDDEPRRPREARFVANPDENFMFYWLAVNTTAVLYNLWTCIAREAFPEIREGTDFAWFVADCVCDLIYLLDIFVQARTGYLEHGLIVYNGRKLLMHYVRSRPFLLDCVSLTPLDLIQFYVGIHPLVRFPRFLKSYRLYRFVYLVETRTVYPNMWRVANLSHVLFLGSHWFAAFYFLISKAEDFQSHWGYPPPVGNFSSVTQKYLRSLYWSTLTLTTIGDLQPPETNWE